MNEKDKEVMNLKEVSEFLDIHINTLRRWMVEGKIKGHKVGRKWMFLREELIAWIKEHE